MSGGPGIRDEGLSCESWPQDVRRTRRRHVAEHQRLFHRVHLDLGVTDAAKLPMNERIEKFSQGNDPQLAALYFQFGRYLLISCSRPGGQPATLQGLWNDSMTPPWDSKYTININTEMNYWPAEPTNLGECTEPLIRMVGELVEPGSRAAKVNWGAGGGYAITTPTSGGQPRRSTARPGASGRWAARGFASNSRTAMISAATSSIWPGLSDNGGRGAVLPRYARRGT